MEEAQTQPELVESPINGHALTKELITEHIESATTDTDGISADREATRYLSAATQISLEYAENVVDRILNEPFRALAPTFGVDVPVVVKWAIKALQTRDRRDAILVSLLFVQAVLVALLCIFIWLWTLILVLVVFVMAWLVVSWEYWERMHKIVIGKMLRDRFKPDEAPVPVRDTDKARLRDIAERRDGNLVVFSGHSAFIGSGDEAVDRRRLLLNVSRGKPKKDGTAKKPDHFTSQDLHTALVEAFGPHTGLAKSLDNVKVYERLFVNGLHVHENKRLLPDPLRPPLTSVDKSLLSSAAIHPSPEARTYVCVEMPGWQGQLVVTLFIRAVYTGASLFVEWSFRVLPPLRAEFLIVDRLYENRRRRQLSTSLTHGFQHFFPALLKSPVHAIRIRQRPYAALRRKRRQANEIKSGYVFNYGARRSIREDASGKKRSHYFLARDETMYMLLAQDTLLRAVESFLTAHRVDLGQFKEQVKVIFDNSINIGNIKESTGVVIGHNSSAKVKDSPKEQK
jgi:hypothetical protein